MGLSCCVAKGHAEALLELGGIPIYGPISAHSPSSGLCDCKVTPALKRNTAQGRISEEQSRIIQAGDNVRVDL